MSVTSGNLDLENAILNGEQRHIECTSTEIEDEDVARTLDLLDEVIGNGGGSGFIDDTEYVEARDETSVLGRLTMEVVEYAVTGTEASLTVPTR